MQVETDADRFVRDQLQPELRPSEELQCAAYLTMQTGSVASALRAKAFWAAFTNERLFLIEARVGAFGPLAENHGLTHYERGEIAGAVFGKVVLLKLPNGTALTLATRDAKLTTQQAFLDLVRSHYGQTAEGQALVRRTRKRSLLSLAVGLLIAGVYLSYVFYFGKAEVRVLCEGAPDGVQCTLRHMAGGATADTSWDVEIRCANGKKVVAHATGTVKPHKTEVVMMGAPQLAGLDACDTPESIDVKRVKVK